MGQLVHYIEYAGETERHVVAMPSEFTLFSLFESKEIADRIPCAPGITVRVDFSHVRQLDECMLRILASVYDSVTWHGGSVVLDVGDDPGLKESLRAFWPGFDIGDAHDNESGRPAPLIPPPSLQAGGCAASKPAPDVAV
jgi:hypothetical protein